MEVILIFKQLVGNNSTLYTLSAHPTLYLHLSEL